MRFANGCVKYCWTPSYTASVDKAMIFLTAESSLETFDSLLKSEDYEIEDG